MPRHGSSLSWLEPASSGGLSPMQLLVAWLSRHYTAFSRSSSKAEMLEELCQGMRDSGFPNCTVHAIRSRINSLKREALLECTGGGGDRHSRAFQQFQQPLMVIFTREDDAMREVNDTSDTETSGEDDTVSADNGERGVKTEAEGQDGSRSAPFVVEDEDESGVRTELDDGERRRRRLRAGSSLDATEIRRRFELLCARHELQQQGIGMELIDRMLPLPED